ncbi:MAG: glucosamine-6-phosphate deaminase [Chloroflexota bacterium]
MLNPALSIAEDPSGAAQVVADLLEDLIRVRPDASLALPTGRTPLRLYDELAERYRAGRIDFRAARAFNLDEWVGVTGNAPGSYARFMNEHLFSRVNLAPTRRAIPDGLAPDLTAECARYERRIHEAGGIDLAILGIGRNGHIGFNEPDTPFDSRTHVVEVTAETRVANRWSFPDGEVPTKAITVGIATILGARQVVLLATGAAKADVLRRLLDGPIDPAFPASALRLHPRVQVVADALAARTNRPEPQAPENFAAPPYGPLP